jgi:ABC-2 type transport system permease protein
MKKILAIAWKDTLLRFASRSELLFFLILPIVFTTVLTGAGGDPDADNRIPLPVVNEDGRALSQELVTALAESKSVRGELMMREDAESRFADGDVPAILIIPADFEDALRAGRAVEMEVRAQPNNTNAAAVQQAIRSAADRVAQALDVARRSLAEAETVRPFGDAAGRSAYFEQSLSMAQQLFESAPQRIDVTRPAVVDSIDIDVRALASAGQLITWVFIPLLGTSALFAYERDNGTLRRLLTTPTEKSTFLLGTITGQLGSSLVQMLLLVGFGIVVMGVSWGRSPAALAVMLVTFGIASVAFGTMLGTFIKTQNQANGMSTMLGMVMALLGGCMYPIELFPEAVRTAVQVLPTYWAMQGMTDLAARGQGLADVLPEAGVLLAFATVFFVIGVRRFRYE